MIYNGYVNWKGRQVLVSKTTGPSLYIFTVATAGPITEKEWDILSKDIKQRYG